jgi:hypothetical protein
VIDGYLHETPSYRSRVKLSTNSEDESRAWRDFNRDTSAGEREAAPADCAGLRSGFSVAEETDESGRLLDGHPSVPVPPAQACSRGVRGKRRSRHRVHGLGGGSVAAPFTTGSADISDPEAR